MSSPAARLTGLDGLRAIAVLLVVVYHAFPGSVLRSGFVGVDVFFVVSGFLITTLLLREQALTGRIALGAFWRRRARRLLPALVLVVTAAATGAWIAGGDVLVGLGRQLVGAATFSYNWLGIAADDAYFAAHDSELLRNLWSLAVEEQFYLLWPLLLPLLLLLRGRAARVAVALVAAVASALWAAALIGAGASPTRVYYGTDTHAFGLLLGVALAFAAPQRPARRASVGGVGPAWGAVIGGAAVIALVALATTTPGVGAATFPGVLVAASVCSAVALTAAVRPGSWFGRAMDAAPLRWIGERSYGVYLWHWPLLVLLPVRSPFGGVAVVALTVALAALSFRFVEQPIRRRGFRASVAWLREGVTSAPRRRALVLGSTLAAALLVAGTTAAVASSPRTTSGQTVVEAGQAALDAARAQTTPAGAPSRSPTANGPSPSARTASALPDTPSPPASVPAGTVAQTASAPDTPAPGPRTPTPVALSSGLEPAPGAGGGTARHPRPVSPTPAPVDGARVSAIGDSVMLASAPSLLERFPGIQVDAAVSRSMYAAPGIVAELAAAGALRDEVVLALGTNGPIDRETLDEVLALIGPDRWLVLVTAHAPRDWTAGVNAELAAFAEANPHVVLADWSTAIAPRTGLLAEDEIHPGPEGGDVFADVVAGAIERIENQRAQLRYRLDLALWGVDALAGP